MEEYPVYLRRKPWFGDDVIIIYPNKPCAKCGADIQYERGVVYTSRPVKYRHVCPKCGDINYLTQCYGAPIGISRGN